MNWKKWDEQYWVNLEAQRLITIDTRHSYREGRLIGYKVTLWPCGSEQSLSKDFETLAEAEAFIQELIK